MSKPDPAVPTAPPVGLLPSSHEVDGGRQWRIDINGSDCVGVVEVEGETHEEMDTVITVSKLPHFILKACRKIPMLLLLLLAIITLASGIAEEGLRKGCRIGSFILVFYIVRIASASFSSYYLAKKMEQWLIQKNKSQVTVIRDGKPQEVRICDIVEGDIVCLTVGNRIPADGLLIHDNALVLDGDARTKTKTSGFRRLYSGTVVLDGTGFMLVTSAGADTELSKTMRMVTNFKDDDKLLLEASRKNWNPSAGICDLKKETLVRNWIDEPLAWLGNFALVILIVCVLVDFIIFSLCGQNKKNNLFQELKGAAGVEGLIKIFKQLLRNGGKIRLLAAFMPPLVFGLQHGIKVVISFCLHKWNEMRGSSEQLCQNSWASRTLGVTSVICIDVLARLMFQKRAVSRFLVGQEDLNGCNFNSKISQSVLEPLKHGVWASILVAGNGCPSRTDGLIISWVEKKWNIDIESDDLKERFEIAFVRKPSSNKEGRGVLFRRKGNGETGKIWVSHWKGGAKTILGMCSYYFDWEGQIHGIEHQKSEFEQVVKQMECNGIRAIAFAYKQTQVQELAEDGLCLLAIVGVKYRCHEGMKSAVRALKNSGRSIKLVSKDKPSTLRAMAGELGLYSPVSTGKAVEIEHHVSMAEKMDQITMMRTSNPKDKLLMLKSLKQTDNVVAFIGGWTTRDAPVLQEADVGITIKTWSTEVTREISDIVLTSDSSFSSLITQSGSGGQEYKNIQKFLQIQIISNVSALLITAVETVCLGESSLTILHALYVNMVLAILGGLMLVMKPQHNELISSNPIGKRKESTKTKLMRIINILVQVSYQVVIFLVLRFKGKALLVPGMNKDVRKAMIFNGFLLCQVFNHFHPLFDSGKFVIWLFLLPFTGVFVWLFPQLLWKLNLMQWALCFLIAVLSLMINLATTLISILIENK